MSQNKRKDLSISRRENGQLCKQHYVSTKSHNVKVSLLL